MGTTTEELKKLYAKLGGTDPNIPKASTPGEVLNGINELELGGDKLPVVTEADNGKALGVKQGQWDKMDVDIELPDVTSEDAGKVLMVNDEGNWAKDDLPNNSNVVMYEVKGASGGSGLELKNATIGDLKNDFDAGKIIILKNTSGHAYSDGDMYYCSGKKGGESISDVTFFRIAHMSVNPIKIKVDGCYFRYTTPSVTSKFLSVFSDVVGLTPNVSASDNGKILKVDNGVWTAANETKELPAVTASDNGNVLTVVNGAWAKAAASGNVVIIEATKSGNYANLPSGVTIQNIRDLVYIDRKAVIILVVLQYEVWPYIISTGTPSSYVYGFSISDNDTTISAKFIKSDGDTSFYLYSKVLYTTSNGYLLPNVSSSDNNKIMQVVNGSWSKVNLPTELPAVTASDNGKILKVVDGVWTAVDPNA